MTDVQKRLLHLVIEVNLIICLDIDFKYTPSRITHAHQSIFIQVNSNGDIYWTHPCICVYVQLCFPAMDQVKQSVDEQWSYLKWIVNVSSVSPVPFSVSELEASVDKLQKEVEQLREQRNQQKQLADSSARQRDMYKALLTQSTGFSLPPQGDTKILTYTGLCGEFVLNSLCNAVYRMRSSSHVCLQFQILQPTLHRSGPQSQLLALLLRELPLLSQHRLLRPKLL